MNFFKIAIILILLACATNKNGLDARLSNFKYPFKVYNFQFTSQNQKLEMSYMDVNSSSQLETIVLLHGKNFAGFYWKNINNT